MTYPNTQLFIDGAWTDAESGRTIPVVDPSTGDAIGNVAHASTADLDRALLAAQRGFAIWRATPAAERRKIMRRAAELLRERVASIATVLTEEQGKPLAEATGEAAAGADTIDWFADEGMRVYGRVVPARNAATTALVLKGPVGPVAAFTPWNFPINQAVRKISAALAAGCSMILKAPEETPASPAALVRAFADAGLPNGVLNLVYGTPDEISRYLIAHPIIRKVTFTGSTAVGKLLAALAGQHMKRVTMELGGHAPVLVAADADIELAVATMGTAKFRNAGQVCTSPTRFLVHSSIYPEFVARLGAHAKAIVVGSGLAATSQMGPLANARRTKAMAELTEDAVQRGAELVAGGASIGTRGNFWSPTILSDVSLESRFFNEEPFGPLAGIRKFDSLDDAIEEANRLPYGLSSYAFTRSLKTAHRLMDRLETGMLWINQASTPFPELPFGGVKDSGYGSEGGPEAMDAYLTTRTVSITDS